MELTVCRRGRPRFEVTEARKRRVAECLAAGMDVAEIARSLKISRPTVRKYFGGEIETRRQTSDKGADAARAPTAEARRQRVRAGRCARGEFMFRPVLPADALRQALVAAGELAEHEAPDPELDPADRRMVGDVLEALLLRFIDRFSPSRVTQQK